MTESPAPSRPSGPDQDSDEAAQGFGTKAVLIFVLLMASTLVIAFWSFTTRKSRPFSSAAQSLVRSASSAPRMIPFVAGRLHHRPLRALEGMAATLIIFEVPPESTSDLRAEPSVIVSYALRLGADGSYRSSAEHPLHDSPFHHLAPHAGQRVRVVLRAERPFGQAPLEAVKNCRVAIDHGTAHFPLLVPTPIDPLFAGNALDEEGTPLYGATVSCEAAGGSSRSRWTPRGKVTTWVQADGSFQIYPRAGWRPGERRFNLTLEHPALIDRPWQVLAGGDLDVRLRCAPSASIILPKTQFDSLPGGSLQPKLIRKDGSAVDANRISSQNFHRALSVRPGRYRLQYISRHGIVEHDAGPVELTWNRPLDLSGHILDPQLREYSLYFRSSAAGLPRDVILEAPQAALPPYDTGVYRSDNEITIFADRDELDISVKAPGFKPTKLRVQPGMQPIVLSPLD